MNVPNLIVKFIYNVYRWFLLLLLTRWLKIIFVSQLFCAGTRRQIKFLKTFSFHSVWRIWNINFIQLNLTGNTCMWQILWLLHITSALKIICWRRQPGLPSIFLKAQLCGFKITLVYHLIWNNLNIQYFIYIWDGFTVPSLMDTVQDRNHCFLVMPVITLNKPRAVILFGKLQLLPCGTKNLREFIFADWWFFCVLQELIFEIRTDWF